MKLYTIDALLKCSAVIAAESEAAALAEVESWERAWVDTGDIIGVADSPEVTEIQEITDGDDLSDLAHAVVNAAGGRTDEGGSAQ